MDGLTWWADANHIHELTMKLADLEQENNAAGFLGVCMKQDQDTDILEMKQSKMIGKIIEALSLDNETTHLKVKQLH